MLIISRVCAEFKNPAGEVVFRVNPGDLGLIREAPEAIREALAAQMNGVSA